MHKLIVDALSFAYGNEKIIDKFSYVFTPGRPYALTGDSGRGKTTLLRLIAGLLRPDAGRITGGGDACSVSFQDYRLFPTLTAEENAALTSDNAKAATMLRHFSFSDDDLLKLPAALSGGMQQRVSLTRAFLSPRPVLLLDEPYAALDPGNKAFLSRIIAEESAGRIVIFVSHNEAESEAVNAITLAI